MLPVIVISTCCLVFFLPHLPILKVNLRKDINRKIQSDIFIFSGVSSMMNAFASSSSSSLRNERVVVNRERERITASSIYYCAMTLSKPQLFNFQPGTGSKMHMINWILWVNAKSITRWLEYFSLFGYIQQFKFAQNS